jgi:serine/threonine protein kinase
VQTRVFVQLAFFPRKLPPQLIRKIGPRLDSDGIDLVSKFLLYEARKRISARDAMRHPYFDSLGPGVHNLLDGEFFFLGCLSSSSFWTAESPTSPRVPRKG